MVFVGGLALRLRWHCCPLRHSVAILVVHRTVAFPFLGWDWPWKHLVGQSTVVAHRCYCIVAVALKRPRLVVVGRVVVVGVVDHSMGFVFGKR